MDGLFRSRTLQTERRSNYEDPLEDPPITTEDPGDKDNKSSSRTGGSSRGWRSLLATAGATTRVVKRGQSTIKLRSSVIVIRLEGSRSKMRLKITTASVESGKIDWRKNGCFRYARNVESSKEARFQGLRPQVRLTRMTPRAHTSLAAVE